MSDLNNLHTAISEHFNVGTLEEFSAKMQTPEARKNFYDAVTAQNINLGDYDDYENRLKQPDFEDELDEETQVDEVEITEKEVIQPEVVESEVFESKLEKDQQKAKIKEFNSLNSKLSSWDLEPIIIW